jgi:hypothetical protein
VITKDEGPANGELAGADDGALVGVDAAVEVELATSASARDGEAVATACCFTIEWRRCKTGARKQVAAQASAATPAGVAAGTAAAFSGLDAS